MYKQHKQIQIQTLTTPTPPPPQIPILPRYSTATVSNDNVIGIWILNSNQYDWIASLAGYDGPSVNNTITSINNINNKYNN